MQVADVVTGHYLKEGKQLQITLEGVNVEDNRIIWRDTLTAATPDMIAMREQITAKVQQGLLPALGASTTIETGTRPKNEQAYDLYLHSISVPHDPAPNREAIGVLERVVGMDEGYAPAWAELGQRYYYDATYSNGGEQMIRRSNTALERALALDPDLIPAAVQLAVNRVERREPGKAYEEAQTLVKNHPQSAQAHFALAYVLRYAGMLEESAHQCDLAMVLDPGNYQYRSCSWSFGELGKAERAKDFVRLDAGSEWAKYVMPRALLREGKVADARAAVDALPSNPYYHRDLLEACLSGQAADLDRIAREAENNTSARADPEPLYDQASILAFCGKKDAAVSLLRVAIERDYCPVDALQHDPLMSKLRQAPEFASLLAAAKECQRKYLVGQN